MPVVAPALQDGDGDDDGTPSGATALVPAVPPADPPALLLGDGESKEPVRTSVDKSALLEQLRRHLTSLSETLTREGFTGRVFLWQGIKWQTF